MLERIKMTGYNTFVYRVGEVKMIDYNTSVYRVGEGKDD